MNNPYRQNPNECLTLNILRRRLKFLREWIYLDFQNDHVLDIGEENLLGNTLRRELSLQHFQNTSGDLNGDFQPKEEFDVIFCFEVLEHLQNPLLFLSHLVDRLKKRGRLYLTTPRVSLRCLKMDDHFHEFGERELLNLFDLEGSFNILEMGTTKSNYPRNIFWRGVRPLLRALLQKSFYIQAVKIKVR